uniref:Uncharacterized protein n=1 Tax=Anguilla anguilla TaxID=7936 RepID=A0A0E9R321_ANGAN
MLGARWALQQPEEQLPVGGLKLGLQVALNHPGS